MSAFCNHSQPKGGCKDRDEDLLLFRELHRRDNISLLQPVSNEFEPNYAGSIPIYRIASAKKSSDNEFLADNDKNDYNWLKTPPATPLFPSLEMEPGTAEVVLQRELPIIQPLSRSEDIKALGISNFMESTFCTETFFRARYNQFAGNSKETNQKSLQTKAKVPPRSVAPSQRSSSLLVGFRSNKLVPPLGGMTRLNEERGRRANATPSYNKVPTSNNPKVIGTDSDSKAKPRIRGVSPLVRSSVPSQFPGFSNETPPNLRKDRATSASRGRPATNSKSETEARPVNPRRQSCSPSVTRGRKEPSRASEANTSSSSTKAKSAQIGVNGSLILGSRMVEKMMNARKLGADPKPAPGPPNASGLGRMIKNMDAKRDRIISTHHLGTMASRSTPRGDLTK
ncbi:hypothetical protein CDL15_Pgr018172 [Punica granatum]|uniref:Uncharacterized protein n=1 Tax=Punica granatum TaxID=22663 RepID=A0A218WHI7_PUNGR|nr:hypothetical protein CDL15_Pgr018172 [Punica granatum]PKI45126.1 hypothetical protein CRG98_034510 [Punica granatum]